MPPQPPGLPTGWDSDYDGTSQRFPPEWFYVYRPTGQTQLQFPKPGDHLIQTIINEQTETPLVKELESVSVSPSQESEPVIDSASDIKQPAPTNPAQQPIRRLSELARKPMPQSSTPKPESTQSPSILTSTSVPTAPQISSPTQTQQNYQPSQHLLTAIQIQQGYLPSPLLQNTSPTNNLNHTGSTSASQPLHQPVSPASNNGTQSDTDPHRIHTPSTSSAPGIFNITQATQSSLPQSGVQGPGQGVQHIQKPQEHHTINSYQPAHSTASSNSPIAQPNSIASTSTPSLHSSHGYPPILPSSPAPSYSTQQDSCKQSPLIQHSQNTIQVSSPSPEGGNSHSPTQTKISSQLHNQHGFQNMSSHSPAHHSTTSSVSSQGPSHISYTTPTPPTASPSSNNPQRFGMPPGHPLIHAGIYIVYPRLPSQSQQTYTYQPLNQPQPPAPLSALPKPQNAVQGQCNQHIHSTVNIRPPQLVTHPKPSQIQHTNGATHFQPQISVQQTAAQTTQFQTPQNTQYQQPQNTQHQPLQNPQHQPVHNSQHQQLPNAQHQQSQNSQHQPLHSTQHQQAQNMQPLQNAQHRPLHNNQHQPLQNAQHQQAQNTQLLQSTQNQTLYNNQHQRPQNAQHQLLHSTQHQPLNSSQQQQQQQHVASGLQASQSPGIVHTQNSSETLTQASLTATSPSGQVPQITHGTHSIQQQNANVRNAHAQQVQNQANIFSAPASLAAKANRGDIPAKFAVGAANTANKAVSGAKNLFRGTAGKKVAVAVGGAVVGEALGLSGAQGARLANAMHNQYQNNNAQQNGQPAVSQGSVAANSGGNPQRPGTVQGYTRPNSTVPPAAGHMIARPNSTYQPNFQGVGTGLPAGRPNAPGNAQVQAYGRRPVGQQRPQGNLGPTSTNDTILQLGQSIQQIIQQSSTREQPQHPFTQTQQQKPSQYQHNQSYENGASPAYQHAQQHTDSVSDFQGSQSEQFVTNLASSRWDSASSGTEQQSYSQSVTPQPLFYTSGSQSSEQLQQTMNDQSITVINQSLVSDNEYTSGFPEPISCMTQSSGVYVEAQPSEIEQSVNEQSTTIINQSISSSVMYTNDSPDFASSQQAISYSNVQLSDQVPEQSFDDHSAVTATNNNYVFTEYSSAQVNTQETSHAQVETQASLTTDTYFVDDGSNISADYSTNIDIETDISMSQYNDQCLDGSSIDATVDISVQETDSYNVNEYYSVDSDW